MLCVRGYISGYPWCDDKNAEADPEQLQCIKALDFYPVSGQKH